MNNFKIIKKGYSQVEVDNYIERMQNDYETKLSEQKDRIFYLKDQLDKITSSTDSQLITSLVAALERAKIIETSSKNIYELETKKLNLLYSKMENLLRDESLYQNKSVREELLSLIHVCKKSLQNNMLNHDKSLQETNEGDPVRRLLSKMMGANKLQTVNDKDPNAGKKDVAVGKDAGTSQTQKTTGESENREKSPKTKPVHVVRKQSAKDKGQISAKIGGDFNEYMSNDAPSGKSNFENIMFSKRKRRSQEDYVLGADLGDYEPNESGFDLKEAVNPKEDLDEIMKAFDFFNDNKKKK